jgi:hypothetical protein
MDVGSKMLHVVHPFLINADVGLRFPVLNLSFSPGLVLSVKRGGAKNVGHVGA